MLVSEWVDGIDFSAVGGEPDPVRDRYAEIVYRFFYGTARELDVALGDPHPGNYLLRDDGQSPSSTSECCGPSPATTCPGGGDLRRDP